MRAVAEHARPPGMRAFPAQPPSRSFPQRTDPWPHRPRPATPSARAENLADLLLVVAVLYGVACVTFRTIDSLVMRSFDDAFYYSRIADNLGGGLGSTFDGIHPTNGYQPLWQWLLVPIFSERGWSLETLYRLQLGAEVVLPGSPACCCATFSASSPRAGRRWWARCCSCSWWSDPALNGMETALQMLALLLLPAYAWRVKALAGGRTRATFALGLLMGLAMLARLDLMFLPLLIGIVAAAQWIAGRDEPRRAVLVRTAALVAGLALVVEPYMAWNGWAFGAAVPISGMLKWSFPVVDIVATP